MGKLVFLDEKRKKWVENERKKNKIFSHSVMCIKKMLYSNHKTAKTRKTKMARPRKPMSEKCVRLWCSAPVGAIEELDCNIASIRQILAQDYGFDKDELENILTRSRVLQEFIKLLSTPLGRDILLNSFKIALGIEKYEQTKMKLD